MEKNRSETYKLALESIKRWADRGGDPKDLLDAIYLVADVALGEEK